MPFRPTIKDHYKALENRDLDKWNEFRAELVRKQKLTYFERSVCAKPDKSLFDLPSVVRTLMIQFLGFTHENFDSNTMPELPAETDQPYDLRAAA